MTSAREQFAPIEEGRQEFRAGRMLVVADDEDCDCECNLVIAADKVTPEAINFMTVHGRGLIRVSMTESRLEALQIPMMVQSKRAPTDTNFTVSVDARSAAGTAISAHGRAATILALMNTTTRPDELSLPGHVFPIRAMQGGVLRRADPSEAGVDLARLAGLRPGAVLCEILAHDGSIGRLSDALALARTHELTIITITDLIEYRRRNEKLVQRAATIPLPTEYGDFVCVAYETYVDDSVPLALVLGDVSDGAPVLVRVHSECLTGDVFGSQRCDCGLQLHKAMSIIREAGRGVLVYMRQEGRGIGLLNKLKAYELQDRGKDTIEANHALGFSDDLRHYGIGAQILVDLGLKNLRLLTNNPKKIVGIEGYGLHVVERVSLEVPANENNFRYLQTKSEKMGHCLRLSPQKANRF